MKTYCTVNICDTEDCEYQKESHNITIPVEDGLFPRSDNTTGIFESRSVSWLQHGARRGIISVQLQNSKQVHSYNYYY